MMSISRGFLCIDGRTIALNAENLVTAIHGFLERRPKMPKFVRIPEVVDAFQMTKEARWDNNDWPEWLFDAWDIAEGLGAVWCREEPVYVGTPEGTYNVAWGDWIVRDSAGDLWLYPDPAFHSAFKLAQEEE